MLSLWTGQEGPVGATGTGHVSEARALGLPVAPAARSTGLATCSLAVGPEQPLQSEPSAVGPLDREGATPLSTAWQRVRLLATDQPPVCGGFATPVLFLWSAQNRGWGRGEGPINTTRDPLNREQRVPEGGRQTARW